MAGKIYACYKCNFKFERIIEPKGCPDCNCNAVREVFKNEREEYIRNRKILELNKY